MTTLRKRIRNLIFKMKDRIATMLANKILHAYLMTEQDMWKLVRQVLRAAVVVQGYALPHKALLQ